MHSEFAPVAYITCALLFLPLPWHWRSGNVATLSILAWLFITNLIYAVDATVWRGSARITAQVWCDISTKLIIGGNFALPAACLCLCIHLEKVASVRASHTTIADKRRRNLFELFMCWILPIIFMALHYVVQGHRFDIFEDFGCRPATYFSIASILIVWVPPLIMSTASLVYAALAIRHFIIRRLSFAAHLQACNSALNTSRYLRLILMATVLLVWLVVVTSYTLWFSTVAMPIRPWTTWADVHSNFSRVQVFPRILTPDYIVRGMTTLWWMVPVSSWTFVAFFAFGNDAMDEYKRVLNLVLSGARKVVPEKFFPEKKEKKGGFLPSFVGKASVLLPSPPLKTSMTTTTTSSTLSMPPPYSLPPPLPPKKFTDPLDRIDYVAHDVAHGTVEYGIEGRRSDYIVNGAGDYVVDAHRMSLASSVDTSGYTIEVLPSMPPTPSSGFPRSPSSRGSHAVDDYYYNASPSGTFEAPAGEPLAPSSVPRVPSPSPRVPSPQLTAPTTSSSSAAPQPPSLLAPLPPHYMRSEPPMSPRPLTYPAMSPTYRDITSTFSGGRR